MKCIHHIIAGIGMLVSTFLMCVDASARMVPDEERTHLADSLRTELARVNTAADSLRIMFDIYDLSDVENTVQNSKELYYLAKRLGDERSQLEMLRNIASFAATVYDEASAQWACDEALRMPDSEDRNQTVVFIKACVAGAHRFKSEAERDAYMAHLLNRFTSSNNDDYDVYERAAQLFALLHLLSGEMQGFMVEEYANQLNSVILSMPHLPVNYLMNKRNTMAANAYWHNDLFDKSVEADRRQLESFDRMRKYHEQNGRQYRNYALQRYLSITRMMRSYDALSAQELDTLAAEAKRITEYFPQYAVFYDRTPIVEMAKLLKAGRYEDAMPIVKMLADSTKAIDEKRHYLRMLIDTAEKANDPETKQQAMVDLGMLAGEYENNLSGQRLKELQILYDVTSRRQMESTEELKEQNRRATEVTVVSIVLALMLMVFIVLFTRYRGLSKKLISINETLKTERESLIDAQQKLIEARDKARSAENEKSQVITYMGNQLLTPAGAIAEYAHMIVDNLTPEQREYMSKFVDVINGNVQIIQAIAIDVQDISVMETHKLSTVTNSFDANRMAETALNSIRSAVKPEVTLNLATYTAGPAGIITDARRVEAILMSLLSNAAKFTDKGSITLAVNIDREANKAVFSVTDTGIGVPADKAEQIFERFERLHPDRCGMGLGLPNCRILAATIGGEVTLDTSYPGPGSRFTLTIPIN